MSCISTKAQVWLLDFLAGVLIFSLALWIFFSYYPSLTEEKINTLQELTLQAKTFTSILLTQGIPADWTEQNVQSLGITDGQGSLDHAKLSMLLNMSYEQQKSLLGTQYEFLILFLDENRSYLQVDGQCAIGDPQYVDEDYEVRASYVYRDGSGDEMIDDMLDMANDTNISVDIYRITAGNVQEQLNSYLLNNHSDYDMSVIDDIELDNDAPEMNQDLIEGYTYDQDKLLFVAGDLTGANPQNREILGVNFTDTSGCGSYPNITIVKTDPLLDFSLGQILIPAECHSVNASEITSLGRLYKKNPGAGLKEAAIAKWRYGNSTIFYFSHFDAQYLGSDDNYQFEVRQAIEEYLVDCFEVITLPSNTKNMVVLERLVLYDNQLVTMVVYLWEPR